jgi:hypothetical protein
MGRVLWRIEWWIAAGLTFWLAGWLWSDAPRARFWYAELVLYAVMIWRLRRGGFALRPARIAAPFVYVGLVWLFGMAYEATLSVDGSGIGGMHQDTLASYAYAQGSYVPMALLGLIGNRMWRLDFHAMFFVAGGISLTEGLIFTGVLAATLLSSGAWIAPILLAYYTLAYASFLALPLLIIDPTSLQSSRARPAPPIWALWLGGFGAALIVQLFFGLIWAPLIDLTLSPPPNLVD